MKSTIQIDNFKDFEPQFKIIDKIENFKNTVITLGKKELLNSFGRITKSDKQLRIEISDKTFTIPDNTGKINDINATILDTNYIISSFSIININTNFTKQKVSRNIICSANILKSENFNEQIKSKFKCIISAEISKINTFHYQFETVTYQDNHTNYFYDCIRIKISSKQFDLTQIKINGKGYFIIESFDELKFSEFEAFCFSIKIALGFITSYMPGGEIYYFSFEGEYYYCNHQRPHIDSMYYPLNWNSYSILSDKKEIAEKFNNKLTLINLKIFSNLVSNIYRNQEFSSAILLLLEASSIRSLLIIPSVFSIIVEALSKIISKNEEGKELPINDDKLWKKIKKELITFVNLYSGQISKEGILKLTRRLNDLNKPVIKKYLSNNEKLTLPFEQLKIQLTIDDINVIEHRNDLLHGNLLLMDSEYKTLEEKNNYMNYISSKLYTLISALILKYVGFNGYIINYAKFYEELCYIKTNEDYYRYI